MQESCCLEMSAHLEVGFLFNAECNCTCSDIFLSSDHSVYFFFKMFLLQEIAWDTIMKSPSVHLTVTMMGLCILTVHTHGVVDGGTTRATNQTSMESMETHITQRVSTGITGKGSITQ